MILQHSPSSRMKSELLGVRIGLWTGKRLRENVGGVVSGRTIDELDVSVVNCFADEVIANVDMFRTCMILIVFGESDSGLIVAEESRRKWGWTENFSQKTAEPKSFFRGVSSGDVFSFGT